MSYALASIGPHFFYTPMFAHGAATETPNFETLDFDSSFNWHVQQRIGRDPALQFTGPGEDVIQITGRLFPHHFGGLQTLENIKNAGREGKPLTFMRYHPGSDDALVDDQGRITQKRLAITGRVVGPPGARWVIRRVKKTEGLIGFDGIAHKVDFSIELALFGEDNDVEFAFAQLLGPVANEPTPTTSGSN